MIIKVENFWWGLQRDKNQGFRFFAVQANFLLVNTQEPHQSCRTGVFGCLTTSHRIARQNIDRKVLFV